MVALTEALAVFEGFMRFRLVLGLEPVASGTVVEPAAEGPLP
jgi:hypothetical protein